VKKNFFAIFFTWDPSFSSVLRLYNHHKLPDDYNINMNCTIKKYIDIESKWNSVRKQSLPCTNINMSNFYGLGTHSKRDRDGSAPPLTVKSMIHR